MITKHRSLFAAILFLAFSAASTPAQPQEPLWDQVQANQEYHFKNQANLITHRLHNAIDQQLAAMASDPTLVGKPFSFLLTGSEVAAFKDRHSPMVPLLVNHLHEELAAQRIPAQVSLVPQKGPNDKALTVQVQVLTVLPRNL